MRSLQTRLAMLVLLAAPAGVVEADAPQLYAIRGARLVTASGPDIAAGTIVIRDGLIESIGADVTAPEGATIIEGDGLVVYPGLIDMGHVGSVEVPRSEAPRDARSQDEVERWKRGVVFRPELLASDHLKVDGDALKALPATGVTSVLAVPGGEIFRGRSAFANVVGPDDAPKVGSLASDRAAGLLLASPVAQHVAFPPRPRGNAYPNSLMGVIAFVRQSLIDARHHAEAQARFLRTGRAADRPAASPELDALVPVLAGEQPIAFEVNGLTEIRRALALAREFSLDVVLTGALEADRTVEEIKAAKARVVYSLNYPERPGSLAPETDEPLRLLRRRADAPKGPAALADAGITFAFASSGLKDAKSFVPNVVKAVAAGLSADAAMRALTLDAARIAGVDSQVGSLEPGKIANLVVTDRDLFEDGMTIVHVFVAGRAQTLPAAGDAKPTGAPSAR